MSLLADLTWPEAGVRASKGAMLVVPLGSTEQHGPHLPVSTDADLALALALALDSRRSDIVVGSLISYGASGEHAGFPGTLSIGQDALELLLLELGRSAAMTFAHLLLVSTHGGNAEPVRRAVARLRAESRDLPVRRCQSRCSPCAAMRMPAAPRRRCFCSSGAALSTWTGPWSAIFDRSVS